MSGRYAPARPTPRPRLILAAVFLVSTAQVGAVVEADCDAAEARAMLDAYVFAFNQGRYDALNNLIAPEPMFVWHAVAPPRGRTAPRSSDRTTLSRYFKARHSKREVLRITKFNFASTQERDGALIANFNGLLTRRASDLPLERRGFKATVRCAERTQFIVVSIGTPL